MLSPVTAQDGLQQSQKPPYLTLQDALNEALLKSPRASAARAQLPIARSAYLQATVMPNPSFIYLQNFKADKVQELGAQIPVEPPWKLAFRLIAAKRQVTQADLQIIQALWTLRADVRRAYLDAIIAQEMEALQIQLLDIYGQLSSAAEEKYKAGAVPLLEFEKARLATQQTEIEKERQSQRVILAKQHLNIILGRQPDAPVRVPRLDEAVNTEKARVIPDLDNEPKPLNVFIAMAEKSAPQLRVLAQEVRVNRANLASAVGNILPNPVLSFGHLTAKDIGPGGQNQPLGMASSAEGSMQSQNDVTKGYFVGVTVDVPVFDVQQGNIARLKATIKQVQAETASQQNIISDQVANAYRRLLIARTVTRGYTSRVLATSAKVVQMNRESYQYGRSDITAALVGAQLNIQTQTQYLTTIAEYQLALTDLEQAVGTPLD